METILHNPALTTGNGNTKKQRNKDTCTVNKLHKAGQVAQKRDFAQNTAHALQVFNTCVNFLSKAPVLAFKYQVNL